MKMINLVGLKFGRLLVTALEPRTVRDRSWTCKCDCGRVVSVQGGNLRNNHTRSCGCLRNEVTRQRATKHGYSRVKQRTPEYKTWCLMKDRCHNPRFLRYADWGGRGIKVCEEWLHDFVAFLDHVGPKPSSKHSIDRIDNDRGYEPGNVRWATALEQRYNRRDFKKPLPRIEEQSIPVTSKP